MSLLDKIPMPGTPFEGMMQGQELMQRFLMSPVERRHKESQAKHQEAQAKREEALANMPFGGHQLTGVAGQVMGLEMMKSLYGENSPQYQMARNAFDLEQRNTEGLINYRGSLQETMPKRTATTLGKEQMELNDIRDGYVPGTQIPLTPDQQKKLEGQYKLKMQKQTTDPDTRKRNLYAKNVEITLSKINPEDLVSYSGLKGATELAQDEANAALGKTSERYKRYKEAQVGAKTLAKQVRQFYGDSITPGIQEGLNKLTDPSFWRSNPEIALSQYYKFKDILDSEMETYRRALQSTDVYEKEFENYERPMTPLEKKVGGRLNQEEGRQVNNEINNIEKDQLQLWAEEAIAKGANEEDVNKKLMELRKKKNVAR